MNRDALLTLSKEDQVSLILPQVAQIEAQTAQITGLMARIAELESRLGAPPKTPETRARLPPRANLPDRLRKRRRGRPGVSRMLTEHPDRIIEAALTTCPHCAYVLGSADQRDIPCL